MKALLQFAHAVDRVNEKFGVIANWLVLLSCLLSAGNAAVRYGIDGFLDLAQQYAWLQGLATGVGWYGNHANALLEAQWYMFTGIVLLGGPYTLKLNEHVRVDLIYGMVSERTRHYIDIIGGVLFLLPICIILTYFTWWWFVDAFQIGEQSNNAGGLIRWPVKLILPVGFALMTLQGLSEIIKRVAALQHPEEVEGVVVEYERPLQ